MNILIFATFPDYNTAKNIGKNLVLNKYIRGYNIIKEGFSIYEWENIIKEKSEVFAIFPANLDNYSLIETEILKLHPYKVPCIMAIPIVKCLIPFEKWFNFMDA